METYEGSVGLEFCFLTICRLLNTSRGSPTNFPNKDNRIFKKLFTELVGSTKSKYERIKKNKIKY